MKTNLSQSEFHQRRQGRSRRGNEAEIPFAPKIASIRRRLPFLNAPSASSCRHIANLALFAFLCAALPAFADGPKLSGIGATMQDMIAKNEIAGAVTVVVAKNKLLHLETTGFADVAAKRP